MITSTEPIQTRELWFTGPGQVELRTGELPLLKPGMTIVRSIASGVSQGTELLLFSGEGAVPFDPSLGHEGHTTYPCRYGYSCVGEVIACASDVSSVATGDRVFALAPHGDVHLLPSNQVRPISRAIPATRAVLAANMETAVNCIWDSGMSIGDRVAVLGAGTVGLLIAWLSLKIGAEVRVIDPSERRRAVASQLGVKDTCKPEDGGLRGVADIVIEASGNPTALDSAVALAAQEALIVVVSNYGKRSSEVELGNQFHRRRLTIKSSQVSAIPDVRARRWSLDRRFELVKSLLLDQHLDYLVDNVIQFNSAPETYEKLQNRPGAYVQTVFEYS